MPCIGSWVAFCCDKHGLLTRDISGGLITTPFRLGPMWDADGHKLASTIDEDAINQNKAMIDHKLAAIVLPGHFSTDH